MLLSEVDNSNTDDAKLAAKVNVAMHDELTTGSEKDGCIKIQESDLSEKEFSEKANNNADISYVQQTDDFKHSWPLQVSCIQMNEGRATSENEVVDEPSASEPKMEVYKSQDLKESSVATELFLKTQDVNVLNISDIGKLDGCVNTKVEMVVEQNDSYVATESFLKTQDVKEQVGDELAKEVVDEANENKDKATEWSGSENADLDTTDKLIPKYNISAENKVLNVLFLFSVL